MSDLTAQSQQVFSPEPPYTSETITRILKCLEGESDDSLHPITLDMINHPDKYHDLDFMALGRALHLTPYNSAHIQIGGAYQFPKKHPESTQKKLTSCQVGRIAAAITARNDKTKWNEWNEEQFQKGLKSDHSTSVTCAALHPDQDVRDMAAWCAAHLTQIRAQKMGLIDQPSPTQTPRPCLPG